MVKLLGWSGQGAEGAGVVKVRGEAGWPDGPR